MNLRVMLASLAGLSGLVSGLVPGLVSGLVSGGVASAQSLSRFPEPAAYLSFDLCSGGVTHDDALGGHDGALQNGAACATHARYGTSGSFDGVNDVVTLSTSTAIAFTDRMAVSAWIYPEDTSRWQTIVNKWYWPDSWGLFIAPGKVQFTVVAGGSYHDVSAPISAHQWTHVAGVYTGSYVRLYINGALVSQVAASGAIQASSRPIAIGSHPSWNAFDGYIDEVKIYNRSLNQDKVTALATAPSPVGVRGVHLYPSKWVCNAATYGASCNPAPAYHWDTFQRDLDIIHTTGNINTVKSSIHSYAELGHDAWWYGNQNEKLGRIKAATGNHVTHIVRAWPSMCEYGQVCDCPKDQTGNRNYYQCGQTLAHRLIDPAGNGSVSGPLAHMKNVLRLQHVYIEVGNEPNLPSEGFVTASGVTSMGAYNDFFRGFYWGQRDYGYTYPLVYAGLSPGCHSGTFGATCSDDWYRDYWVRDHIQNYAAKVGVHVYWESLNPYATGGRLSTTAGLYYRQVKNLLASGSYSPAVSPRGLQITEFNLNRANAGATTTQQITDVCSWWKQVVQDAAAGWWVEQTALFVSDTENDEWLGIYRLEDDQVDDIRACQ